MLLRKLLGYDIFISYSRADKGYAKKLKEQLSSMDYSCFIDYEKVFPGDRLSGALKRAIRWSSVFVLVGTANSRNSKYVAQEVDEFLKTGRAMVPIFIGESLGKSEWTIIHDNELVWVDEPNAETPSAVVFDDINRLFKYNRVKVWRRTAGTALTLVLLGLSVFATLQAREARAQQALAEQKTAELETKQRELEESTAKLTRQQELLKKQNEDLEKGRQDLEKKTKEAAESAEKARQQEQLARRQEALARRNAELAKEQERIAGERQRVALSRELASNAVAQLQVDQELGLMLAAEAIGVDPNVQSEVALRRSLAESRLRGIARDVNGSALSPDGRLLATAHSHYAGFPGGENVVRVQEAGTGRAVAELRVNDKYMFHPVFSPDGRLLAATCGREVCLFEVGTWRVVTELRDHTDQVSSIRFSHDSRLVLTGDYGKTARVWEAATGRNVATLGPLEEPVEDAQFSPDDKLFLATTEYEVVVAKADSGQMLAELHEAEDKPVTPSPTPSPDEAAGVPPGVRARALIVANGVDVVPALPKSDYKRIISAAWSPDGKYVMTLTFGSGSADLSLTNSSKSTNLSFWRAGDAGEWQPSSELPPEYAKDGRLSPEGRLLLAKTEKDAFTWVAEAAGKAASDYGGDSTAHSALSPDGSMVAMGNYDGSVSLWTYYGSLLAVMRGHTGPASRVEFSRDGRWLVSTGNDKAVRLWDAGRGAARSVLGEPGPKEVWRSEPSPDGKVLVTDGDDNTIRIWEVSTGRQLHIINGDGNAFVVFSPDGQRFLTVDGKSMAHVWDVGSGRSVADFNLSVKPKVGMLGGSPIAGAAFGPGGRMLVTIYRDGDAAVWDTAAGKVLFRPSDPLAEDNEDRKTVIGKETIHLGPPTLIGVVLAAFSPDGGRLVTVHNHFAGRILRVWDARTGRKLYTLRPGKREDQDGYSGDATEVGFSPDNRLFVTADENNGETRVWDVRAGRSVAELSLPGGKKIKRVRFDGDGSSLLTLGEGSAGNNWELRRWDVATWRSFVVAEFSANFGEFSPDFKFAVRMNNLGVYEVLELSTGLSLAELRGHEGRLNSIRFSPDDKLIFTAGSDGTARIYPCELCGNSQDLLEMARHHLSLTGREFTKEERLKFLQALPRDTAALPTPKARAH
jgi:WD40 repeat protein